MYLILSNTYYFRLIYDINLRYNISDMIYDMIYIP